VAQKPQIGDNTKYHFFLDDIILIVTGVNFTVDRACWTLTAVSALQDKCDDRIYIADLDDLDTLRELDRRLPSRSLIGCQSKGGPSMLRTELVADVRC
jgi:hypothetical protein